MWRNKTSMIVLLATKKGPSPRYRISFFTENVKQGGISAEASPFPGQDGSIYHFQMVN
ncbi:hypothetical protein BpJC7_25550 [Weizmannia acidilactici]|uniref:Uncharacterized protein n=1 Tax=Weizmannia acidilactici TaxID=2607726 RepID=A0A5J4J8Q5_9BACI|nr:hypothetical protein BpJC4_11700 [Weizmannia acidilactici]GER71252.1 hypothetical protein BpJC7_25550 [Weizmannia acidilactici]GER72853.1 hypothetical protein BpPP18_09200 [Weizmannia acidilactici]